MSDILIDILNTRSKEYKQKFLRITNIELNKYKSEIFNGHKYNNNIHKNDIFIFCRSNGQIIGLSKGRDTAQFACSSLFIFQPFNTFKNLLETSQIIVRVPAEYLIYNTRYNKKWDPEVTEIPISKRLITYKENKKGITSTIKNIIISLTNHLQEEKIPIELLRFFRMHDKKFASITKMLEKVIDYTNNSSSFYYKSKLFDLEKILKKINWYIEFNKVV